ncbi:hypothetical protein F5Y16DRAFT_160305 [Xylariaceae sp. FL0255]|nr:hypothetical protein F5Y16DRAFT_160305 [Xylariaceae sp. FL0255]
MPDQQPSHRRQTALAVVDAYNKWSLDTIMAVRADNCIHQVLPRTLGRQEMDNATYAGYFGAMIPHFKDFTVTVDDIFEDAQENKVVIWARSTAETEIGPYANEYSLMLYFNEAGDKVTKFLEFVDSQNSIIFFPKLREHIAKKAAST